MLTADDPLRRAPERILVAGTSGSGKTTLAGRISAVVGAPHTEIDGLYHGPDWTPRESFMLDVADVARQRTWVIEWQYRKARPLLLSRVDLLVWLDLPRPVVMRRVVRRTVQRRLARTELWNGNLEGPLPPSSPTRTTSSAGPGVPIMRAPSGWLRPRAHDRISASCGWPASTRLTDG